MHTPFSARRLAASTGTLLFAALLLMPPAASAQTEVNVYATGLTHPIGLTLDGQGRLWVAEQGTGENTGQLSVITTDGTVYPFLTGLRSILIEGEYESVEHIHFVDSMLVAAYGLGSETPEAYLLRIDTTGFTPGDDPLGPTDVEETTDIGAFVLSQGFPQTSLYNFTEGPGGDLFLVDASANALLRLNADDGLAVFATFDPFDNPTPVGPSTIQIVPTAAVYTGEGFLVSALSGFPFLDGAAKVFAVDLEGNVSDYSTGHTLAVDVAVDPRDGHVVLLEYGRFDVTAQPPTFVENTGMLLKLRGEAVDTLATGLNRPAGMVFADDGTLYVTTYTDGEVLEITFPVGTASEDADALPQAFRLLQNYPNPFNPSTTIHYELTHDAHVTLRVYDLLGRPVRTLFDARQAAGRRQAVWDGRDAAGLPVSSGLYVYRLDVDRQVQSRTMLLVK